MMQMDLEMLGDTGPTQRQRLRQSYDFRLQAPRKDDEGGCFCCCCGGGCGCCGCSHQQLRCLQPNTAVWRWPCCNTPQNRSSASKAIMANGVDKLARTDWARLGFRANRSSAASGGEKNRFSLQGKKQKRRRGLSVSVRTGYCVSIFKRGAESR